MSRKNKRSKNDILKPAVEHDALSNMEARNKDLLNFIRNYDEKSINADIRALDTDRVFAKMEARTDFMDDVFKAFLKSVKATAKQKYALENRLRAISFLLEGDPNLSHTGDYTIANLTTLLLNQFKRGVAQGKKEALRSAKRRK